MVPGWKIDWWSHRHPKSMPNAKPAAMALVGVGTISGLFPLIAMFSIKFHMSKG